MSLFPSDDNRTRELILHIAERGADWNAFALPMLHRILFQADFLHFRLYGFPITGQTYLRGAQTPTPRSKTRILREMQASGDLEIREEPVGDGLHVRSVPRALRESDLRMFDGREIALVERVLRHFRENASETGAGDLLELPWESARVREEIPYALGLMGRISPGSAGRTATSPSASVARLLPPSEARQPGATALLVPSHLEAAP